MHGDVHKVLLDMKSGVVTQEIVWILWLYILLLGLDLVMYIMGYFFMLYMSHVLG